MVTAVLHLGITVALAAQIPLDSVTVIQPATAFPAIFSPAFRDDLAEIMKNASIPGISVGAVRLDAEGSPHTDYVALGRRTEDGHDDMTSDTIFGISSCSKAFTATSFGLLIDDYAHGRNVTALPEGVTSLDWDTKVKLMLPDEWQLQDEGVTELATFRDVFSHTTGMPGHDFTALKAEDGVEDVLGHLKGLRPAYDVRDTWSYNNRMYILGAKVVAKYANMEYPEFVASRILRPLNMTDTTFAPSEARGKGRLSHSWTRGKRRMPFWFSDEGARLNAGPAGMLSTAEDMTKWLAVWLQGGANPLTQGTIVPADVYREATTPRVAVPGGPGSVFGASEVHYGAGWMRWHYKGKDVVQHHGTMPGFSSLVAFCPSENIGVVILVNTDGAFPTALKILKNALDDVLGLEVDTISDTKSSESPKDDDDPDDETTMPAPLPLDAYAGTYSAPGYGTVTLCIPPDTSEQCSSVIQDFHDLEDFSTSPSNTSLYAVHRTNWSTHLRLRHDTGNEFLATFTALYPHGYGKDTSAFESYEDGRSEAEVEFIVEAGAVIGFALTADSQAVDARARRIGDHAVREKADAWFVRVCEPGT